MVKLKGKSAIVTGAAVGLGNSYAKALAQEGVNIAVCDLRDEIHEVASSLRSLGVNSVSYQGDVSEPSHVREVVDGAKKEFGSLDILVNNAGVWGASVADDDLDKSLKDYEPQVKNYINRLGLKDYKINFKEEGAIPLFHPTNDKEKNKINIGTAGGMTRLSTGYTFLNIQEHSKYICLLYTSPSPRDS